LAERTRIARELHDTLLQGVQGLMLQFQAVNDLLPAGNAKEALEKALDRADQAIVESRDAIQGLRSSTTNELGHAMAALGEEFGGARYGKGRSPTLRVSMEGTPRELHPILRDDTYRIAREALSKAFLHAQASKIEAGITYDTHLLRLRIRDDGKGIEVKLLEAGQDGHWGLAGMSERAEGSLERANPLQSPLPPAPNIESRANLHSVPDREEPPMSTDRVRILCDHLLLREGVSSREVEVLRLISGGNANKEIAAKRSITEETVMGHIKNLLAKLGANGQTHAVTIGLKR
jgi:DNA-binding CsgD family transcriptional regulator